MVSFFALIALIGQLTIGGATSYKGKKWNLTVVKLQPQVLHSVSLASCFPFLNGNEDIMST